jgi:hypothetical protein
LKQIDAYFEFLTPGLDGFKGLGWSSCTQIRSEGGLVTTDECASTDGRAAQVHTEKIFRSISLNGGIAL